ncbi:DUF2474 domain-containing protein [Rhizorhabdus wittichii]|jgi:hypothetical protein|uniref:DUF2474 domain-containing protein n=1 Tax=Rhizorhabdus wittichii TaxID=160791 RepID=A0A975D6S7_9SPHN|nr:DUF2474 domain-containing protein [Rhizorhabdus wittichii]ARR56644.1 DUF2474 domain-containing protein [Rhizorhabdus wittichii DC-6]QTH22735.1 DUF2474 domain-containing protein [Rhizorhabdus wittichii]
MKPDITEPGPLWRRLAWFVGIWAASVALLGLVAWVIRRMING